jgi:hypothetical protein
MLIDISTLEEEIIKQLEKNSNTQQIKLALKNNKSDILPFKTTRNNWTRRNNLLYYNNRCYIPLYLLLRKEITKLYHDTLNARHSE